MVSTKSREHKKVESNPPLNDGPISKHATPPTIKSEDKRDLKFSVLSH